MGLSRSAVTEAKRKAAKVDFNCLPYSVLSELTSDHHSLLAESMSFLNCKTPKVSTLQKLFMSGEYCPSERVEMIRDIAAVRENGISKYGDTILEFSLPVYRAAFLRHIVAHCCGEIIDSESSLSHLAHARINALIICGYFGTIEDK